AAPAGASRRPAPRRRPVRPKLTGRGTVLVLVLAVLTVSFASSMRAYLQQQDHISDLHSQIDETNQDIGQLEREKRRWDDDAYVKAQARERLNYIMPGETGFKVLDENGEPLDSADQLTDAGDLPKKKPQAWWGAAWKSVEAAGHPDQGKADTPPDRITPTQ
uniref:FtsB family cell division protein n=1 Tax=Nocardioides jensenii TaxID=1843 RepID=UPI000B079D1D